MEKTLSVFLCCIMLLSCLCFPSSAAEGKTILYLNYGNITIGENEISGYDQSGNKVTQVNSSGYIITQKNPRSAINKGITVNSAKCNIEIVNLNIRRLNEYEYAFSAQKNADVTVTISGENHLLSGSSHAGLEVGINAKVTINGDGVLYAQSDLQAGIGGGNGQSNGTLIIDSGTIYATGGIDGYSAGIGGGSSGHGGNITINGGVITATAGEKSAGIGSGYICSGTTNIVINGGSVKAVGDIGADSIGNGLKAKTPFSGVYNSNGNTVSPVKFTLTDFIKFYINGIETSPITMAHPDDDSFYLYSDDMSHIVTAYMNDGSVKYFAFDAGDSFAYTF